MTVRWCLFQALWLAFSCLVAGAALRGPGRRGLRRRRPPLPAVIGRRRRCLLGLFARDTLPGAGSGRRRRLGAAGPQPLRGKHGAFALSGAACRRPAFPGAAATR